MNWDGFLVLDKPRGITSRDAVNRVQARLPTGVRLGHTGTLDPLATGVLVLAVGRGTRLAEYVQDQAKSYRAGVRFGAVSTTDDAGGTITAVADAVFPDQASLEAALAAFVGEIDQVPPDFSAVHVEGRRAYRLARSGKPVALQPRRIRIDRIDLLRYAPPHLDLTIDCGKGAYIRSLARDLGSRLGCGGYLTSLRRTAVGVFREEQALPVDGDEHLFASSLRPLADAVANLPRIVLDADAIRRLGHGQCIDCVDTPTNSESTTSDVAIFDDAGVLRAMARRECHAQSSWWRPVKVYG